MVKKVLLLFVLVVILPLVSCVNYPPGNPQQGDEWITEGKLVGLSFYSNREYKDISSICQILYLSNVQLDSNYTTR